MDAVELARQIAAELHHQAVERGCDPWRPLDFVRAEAMRRGLDVEPAAPGAAMLAGGRAVLIASDKLILFENAGSDFEKAALIAHEIGHHELGDDEESPAARDIDLARSAERAPIGLDRVVDYGGRERREVQMDLFAREFLLPRSVARRLHLEAGETATDIASRLGAPFEIVAQQLLDALLLPSIALAQEADQPERPLNDLQRAAAEHRGKAYLLEAGPGTGKTQTLVGRVTSLLDEGVDPRRILVLTFSNKAAGELFARIARKHKDAAAAMWIGTFHAFGLDVIRRFHAELGLPADPQMMDRTEAVELIEEEFARLNLSHYRNLYDPTQTIADILSAISRAKDEVVDAPSYGVLAAEMERRAQSDETKEAALAALEVAKVYDAYEDLKKKANCVDFGDLVMLPVGLLEADATIRAHFQERYTHILVDEYQDVNHSSVRLLTAICASGENLWVVGDANQSIYRFRGASSFNMVRFGKEDFAGAARGRLEKNYRSVEEIVSAFSTFATTKRAGGQGAFLEAERGRGNGAPEVRTVDTGDQQVIVVAEAVQQMKAAGHAFRDQVVLCTGNEKLASIGEKLERLDVPVLFLGSLFERTEVKDLLALLSLLIDRRAMGLVRVACWPETAMSLGDVAACLDHLREKAVPPRIWIEDKNDRPALSEQGAAGLYVLAGILAGFDENSRPWDVLARVLLDRTRVAARLANAVEIAQRTQGIAIWQLMNFVRAQRAAQGAPIARLLDRVRRLVLLGDDRDLRQLPLAAQGIDAVRLMTIHGAKGLEFPVVHVPGLNADTMPRVGWVGPCPPPDGLVKGAAAGGVAHWRAGQEEEQECLFYVALSRARERIFIYAATQKSNGHNRPISPFLERLGAGIERRHVAPSQGLPPGADETAIELELDGAIRFSDAQMSLYQACPRRFLYTHLIQIGGRRRMSPFMQMHEAVRSIVDRIVAEPSTETGEAALREQIDAALTLHGLGAHGYRESYAGFALGMVRYFLSLREGQTPEKPVELRLAFGSEEIIVKPDDVLVRPNGERTVRRVQTRHPRSNEDEDVGRAAFLLAAQQAFPGAVVEFVYLSSAEVKNYRPRDQTLKNRSDKLTGFLNAIRAGRFPPEPAQRVCPTCPAFFVCGPTPAGGLKKKVRAG